MPLGTTLGIGTRRADLVTVPASAVNRSRRVAMAGAAMEGLSGLDVPLSLPLPPVVVGGAAVGAASVLAPAGIAELTGSSGKEGALIPALLATTFGCR